MLLQGYPPRSPVFIKPFQSDNQTYILKYGQNSIKPLGHQIRNNKKRVRPQPHGPKPLKPLGHQIKNRPEPVYSPNENRNNTEIEGKNVRTRDTGKCAIVFIQGYNVLTG